MPFSDFHDQHAATLRAALNSATWRAALARGAIEAAREALLTPPPTANVFSTPVDQLKAINGPRVREMIASGERDEELLLQTLGTWPATWPREVPLRLSFLGLNLTSACDMSPRCVYCNQRPVSQRMGTDDWRRVIEGAADQDGDGPYLYLTGGEPLLLGEDLWGSAGLIRFATGVGAACNLNTNALQLTPQVALGLVSAGLGRMHVSLDTHLAQVQDSICRRTGRWEQVMAGLHNVQLAKALLGVSHPVIHINCVLTRLNADGYPDFLRLLLSMKPRPVEGRSPDLDMHLIPVGGEANASLRLTQEGYLRFFTDTWEQVEEVWAQYQEECGSADKDRGPLHARVPFLSPYHRVRQDGDLAGWAARAADGRPGALAMAARCYVAPTQGFILPNGEQHWCGGHATSRPEPVGNTLHRSVRESIMASLPAVRCLPGEHCHTCAGATLAINQTVESRLKEALAGWLHPEQEQGAGTPEPGFE